ncbi:hypothetical protein Pla100_34760 [Neorhodopirellula pilleata]|uniref:Uncharacterized protein n=1 Tax=Neorhodopirellula pilleata TaxID=2714738 RepID=A0A5C6A699_9BACT|nr:hypothetical protein Pla100_34760 [Neorhodopirellula pilleata]
MYDPSWVAEDFSALVWADSVVGRYGLPVVIQCLLGTNAIRRFLLSGGRQCCNRVVWFSFGERPASRGGGSWR